MYFFPTEDKENYNPDSKTYSPARLVNQKRYKVLKALTMNSMSRKHDELPLKEKTNQQEKSKPQEPQLEAPSPQMKPLKFKDESRKVYGL